MLEPAAYRAARDFPRGPVVMHQQWRDLLFLHFPIAPADIRALIPAHLELDLFEEQAWIGLVPFRMQNVRPWGVPALPRLSHFPETNVRTYVHRDGIPGVWFFSLDAANVLACAIARNWFGLPYYFASMSVLRDGDEIRYRSQRAGTRTDITATLGEALPASPFNDFLVERYVLYTDTHRGWVNHASYQLRTAIVSSLESDLPARAGLPEQPYTHFAFSAGVDVRVHGLQRLAVPR